MAHQEQRDFLSRVKKLFPESFFSVKVLDIGSFNVNGTERDFFGNADITGLDIAEGDCVDVVCQYKISYGNQHLGNEHLTKINSCHPKSIDL